MIADLFRLVREVIGIDANAMAAHHAWTERQKIPLAARSFEHLNSIDTQPIENHGKLVHESDIKVALAVFNDLSSLCNFQTGSLPSSCLNNTFIDVIYRFSHFISAATGDFLNRGQRIDFVTWVDAFWTVTTVKVLIEFEARFPLKDWHTNFLSATRVHRRFIDHDRTCPHCSANCLAGFNDRRQIWTIGSIDRRGDSYDKNATLFELAAIAAVLQKVCRIQIARSDFKGTVFSGTQLCNACFVDVETKYRAHLAKLYS